MSIGCPRQRQRDHRPGVAIQQPGDLGEGEPVGKSGHDENAVVVDMFPGPACGCLCRAGRTVPITSPTRLAGSPGSPTASRRPGRLDAAAHGLVIDLGLPDDRPAAMPADPPPVSLTSTIHLPDTKRTPSSWLTSTYCRRSLGAGQ
jgi:hypothetical protein